MHLGKLGYYADFVIYPVLLTVLSIGTIIVMTSVQRVHWLFVCVLGVVGWTFLEYLLHRFVLHRVNFFDRLHDTHHESPSELIGTPTWLSASFGSLLLLPLWWKAELDWQAASQSD